MKWEKDMKSLRSCYLIPFLREEQSRETFCLPLSCHHFFIFSFSLCVFGPTHPTNPFPHLSIRLFRPFPVSDPLTPASQIYIFPGFCFLSGGVFRAHGIYFGFFLKLDFERMPTWNGSAVNRTGSHFFPFFIPYSSAPFIPRGGGFFSGWLPGISAPGIRIITIAYFRFSN